MLELPEIETEPYYHQDDCTLFNAESLSLLPQFPADCIDMIFADPPYFLSNGGITCHAGQMVSVNKGEWDKSRGVKEDHDFVLEWLTACKRVLKTEGSIWVSGTSHIIYSVGYAMQKLGFNILNDIVWYKTNAPPNLSCRYFTHSTETILWASKSKNSKHVFNYAMMKEMAGGKQMRNVWEITAPVKSEKVYGKHPTQKPLKLLSRIILASTTEDALILDPFVGSGTTVVAAIAEGRHAIGIDIEKDYLDIAIKRIRGVGVKLPMK
ncbi:MAG: site-specific DNA-methyltransferase [Actinobacteria bacterium]|nr:site-specific DNA-methyltransferase [Actinomycetota bacterium]